MLSVTGAQLNGSEPISGKRTHVHEVNFRKTAKFLGGWNKDCAGLRRKLQPSIYRTIRARHHSVTDVLVSLRVFPRDRSGTDDANVHL
jgi:hypothetical protein